MKLEEDHISILQFFITLGALLTLIGTGAIIINTFLSKNFFGHKNIWNRIIFFMSFCDLCGSIDLLMREQYLKKGNEGACKIQGLTIQFFFISSIFWTAAIALNIYLVVVIRKELCDIERYEYIFHIIVWGLSLMLTVPLYILENNNKTLDPIMGNATFWCWITTKHGDYRMMFFFGPLWIVFFFNAFVYTSMIVICKKRDKDMKPSVAGNTIAKRCNLYLLVLFLTWIWGTINRIQNIHNKDYPIFELHLLHAIFTPLQGFLNSLVYFWYTVIKHFISLKEEIENEHNIREFHRHHNNNIDDIEGYDNDKNGNNNKRTLNKNKKHRNSYKYKNYDIYDNYFVYIPQHHHRNNDNYNNNDDNNHNHNHNHNQINSNYHRNSHHYSGNQNNSNDNNNNINNNNINNNNRVLIRQNSEETQNSIISINSASSMLNKSDKTSLNN